MTLYFYSVILVRIKYIWQDKIILSKIISMANEPTPPNNDEFHSLLPYDGIKWNKTFDALHWALAEHKVNNIAITGYFGSGKSSFWESYIKQVKENNLDDREIINISLAKFSCKCDKNFKCDENSSEKSKYDVKPSDSGYKVFSGEEISDYDQWRIYQEQKKIEEELEIEIERGILEQILYSVENNEIPASRFKKITDLSKETKILYSLIILSLITCISFFLGHEKIEQIINQYTLTFIICCLLLSFCIYLILPFFNSFHLSKVSYHEFDIHFEDNKGSLFSQNITELVYFFEKLKNKRIVVFEDLDRFKSSTIFSTLRELNHILNNVPSIKSNQIIFIYMIRDDIFSKYERTKFFDFIIPIVPVLTKDNATGFILKEMKEIEKDCGRQYIEDISPFLGDLRLLKNCENEYKIYKSVNESFLRSKLENDNKTLKQSTCQWIFSMILYKNLYPKDFQKLLQHEGLLYYCIHKAKIDYFKKLDEKKDKGN